MSEFVDSLVDFATLTADAALNRLAEEGWITYRTLRADIGRERREALPYALLLLVKHGFVEVVSGETIRESIFKTPVVWEVGEPFSPLWG
ncbi:MAG: hypothetical protein ACOYBY_18630, partial [Dermatophilaceae bacterium]